GRGRCEVLVPDRLAASTLLALERGRTFVGPAEPAVGEVGAPASQAIDAAVLVVVARAPEHRRAGAGAARLAHTPAILLDARGLLAVDLVAEVEVAELVLEVALGVEVGERVGLPVHTVGGVGAPARAAETIARASDEDGAQRRIV